MPRLLYLKSPAPHREPRLADLVARIEAEAADSYRQFRSVSELARLVRDDLATLLSERFEAGGAAATGSVPALSAAAERSRPPLPADATALIGRAEAIGEVADLLTRPDVRL
jgi:hypothetical protein